ncbi:hypothetical protein HRR83_009161 [Exophiala dermatitidis]|uniref:C3H1-type domain-containing protein n=2 Tax=Exophiala dermatitidis TaxID=5970 RepID=H6C7X3_EXODN|nr:uncharacterized protein HMPREF1120_08170 [Exophiala dermatitidis NIH/UT8656]KAJ4502810.1 hypothetical protein HRR75_008275 [Exophiala dermatitidis]EHY60200.1 hypothetical protein HMPREF1120_08170 [Exophiala dermatitidis NIH/UT8656]KAJ4504362.1 hypothetical protein HRR74_009008 [Exophiala dermatitidis]KAJ4504868.1 hypothetical protein HRR73_008622 [Exophiala dermatitidis]KAJ4530760.1 hypothetical protein HRR76_008457 [Exophiala dermatitidis]
MSENNPSTGSGPPLKAPTEPKHFRPSSGGGGLAMSRLRPHPRRMHHPRAHPYYAGNNRHSSNPIVRSPLQQSFPAYPSSVSGEGEGKGNNNMGNKPVIQVQGQQTPTPSRRSRRNEQHVGRKGGESHRSASVPIIVRTPDEGESQFETGPGTQSQPRTQPNSRATSPFPLLGDDGDNGHGVTHGQGGGNLSPNPLDPTRRSVKHLTCFWWWEKGECRFTDDECLYAHYDTGHYTGAPRQVIPGEPAKAGRSLERALNKLAITNRAEAQGHGHGHGHGHNQGHARIPSGAASRMETPIHVSGGSGSSPSSFLEIGQAQQLQAQALAQAQAQVEHAVIQPLQADNDFLRNLIHSSQREKQAFVDTIESYQNEKMQLLARLDALTKEREAFLFERDVLQATIRKLQFQGTANTNLNPSGNSNTKLSVPKRSPTIIVPAGYEGAAATGRTQNQNQGQNPYGPIGSRRPSPRMGDGTPVTSSSSSQQRIASDGSSQASLQGYNNTGGGTTGTVSNNGYNGYNAYANNPNPGFRGWASTGYGYSNSNHSASSSFVVVGSNNSNNTPDNNVYPALSGTGAVPIASPNAAANSRAMWGPYANTVSTANANNANAKLPNPIGHERKLSAQLKQAQQAQQKLDKGKGKEREKEDTDADDDDGIPKSFNFGDELENEKLGSMMRCLGSGL